MTDGLLVLLEGRVVGHLDRTRRNRLRFVYEDDATAAHRTPLSLSLPREVGAFTGDAVDRFLRALLPDAEGALSAMERRYPGTDRRDPLSLLRAVGKDCPGAVQFCRPAELDATLARSGELVPQTLGDVEQRLAEMRIDERASWSMPGEHWSLGGTQPKFALRRIGDDWFEAHGSQPTSHILKPGVHGMRAQSLVEHMTMQAAAECGVDVAATAHVEFKSETAIVITRFDRADRDGTFVRLHQEDLCQALGAAEKYEEYGGPGAGDVIELLRERSATAAAARANVERFVDGLIFNTVMAAPDAHARNYAVMLAGGDVHLAPLFDVSTALPYAPMSRGRTLSMSVHGEHVAERISRTHWLRFADVHGLDGDAIVERAQEILESGPRAMLSVLGDVEDWGGSAAALRARLVVALDEYQPTVSANLATGRDS